MNLGFKNKERHVIPRWRAYADSVKLPELKASRPTPRTSEQQYFDIEAKKIAFDSTGGSAFASDLISSALVSGDTGIALEAAESVLGGPNETKSELLRKQALRVAGIIELPQEDPCSSASEVLHDTRTRITGLRSKTYVDPRNSIAWVDLALAYVLVGQLDRASRCMNVALSLSARNRFVLRSACRCFMHVGEKDRAHHLLMRSPVINSDPWILSAEIAVAAAIGKTSRNIKRASLLLAREKWSPRDTSELASQLGTIAMYTGKRKEARKLFEKALVEPNDNALAQIAWFGKEIPSARVAEMTASTPCSSEARALHAYNQMDWTEALDSAKGWFVDLPFSSWPVLFCSYIASTAFEDYHFSVELLRHGLRANPDDIVIKNNLAFALLQQNRIAEAEALVDRQRSETDHSIITAVMEATRGLLMFRKGYTDKGRGHYESSIAIASRLGDRPRAAMASVYLAMEEIRAKSDEAYAAAKRAEEYAERSGDPIVGLLSARMQKRLQS